MRPAALITCSLLAIVVSGCAEQPETNDTNLADTSVTSAPATESSASAVTLKVAQSSEHGTYLADANGRALYLLEADAQGASKCTDACAQAWPPLIANQGNPTAADASVQANLISTIQRPDGTRQVTYGGHPLYYYAQDQGPGETKGQDLTDQWGEWYLVTPAGKPLEHGSH